MLAITHALVSAALLASASGSLRAQDVVDQRLLLASKFVELQMAREFNDEMLREMSQFLPQEVKMDFVQFFSKAETKDVLARILSPAAARTFTLEEMQAWIDFYSSPVGRSLFLKQVAFLSLMRSGLDREMTPLFEKYMAGRR